MITFAVLAGLVTSLGLVVTVRAVIAPGSGSGRSSHTKSGRPDDEDPVDMIQVVAGLMLLAAGLSMLTASIGALLAGGAP